MADPSDQADSDPVPAPFIRFRVALRTLLAFPLWLYQRVVSPLLPSSCIYSPTCSEYTRRAILRHGLGGLLLGLFRVLRCAGGLFSGGEDPVPDRLTADYVFGSYRRFRRR